MAEGDTIHRLAGRLEVAIGGQQVDSVATPAPRSPLQLQKERLAKLEGSRIESIEARGKHLLIGFDAGLTLHSHMGMNGSWGIARQARDLRRPARSAWLLIETGRAVAAQFGGPHLALLSETERRREPRISQLGPDLLGDGFDPGAGATRLRELAAGRPLGDALLDQRILAGIGNVLKSEGCWNTRLDPFAPVSAYSDEQLSGLLEAEVELMRDAVASGQRQRRIYKSTGRPCPRCGTPIRSAPQGDANRVTYWCPACQPPPAQA